jgi:hypothetical protein
MLKKLPIFAFVVVLFAIVLYSCNETPITNDPTKKSSYSGVIKDEQSNSVPNALVEVVVPTTVINNTVVEEIIATDTTDLEGNFSIPEVFIPMELAKFRISHPDFKKFEKVFYDFIKDKDPKNVPVALLHNDTCCGKIKFTIKKASDSTTTLNDVEIRLNRNKDVIRKAYTSSDGKLTFENICLNSYWVRIYKSGYKVIEKEFNITNCDSTYNFNFYLQAVETPPQDTCCNNVISILAKNTNNETLNGATVKIRKNGTIITYKVTEGGQPAIFREVCKGTYSFLIVKDGYKSVEFSVTVDCNDTLSYTKEMQVDSCCKGSLKVFVKDSSNNESLNGTTVKLYSNGAVKQTATVENGYVTFSNYCEGTYGLYFAKSGYKTAELSVTIICNQLKEITKKLLAESANADSCCNGVYSVVVKDSTSNNPVSGASVYLYKGSTKIKATTTNSNGVATFTGLCEGDGYSISFSKTNYNGREWSFALDCNDTLEVAKKILAKSSSDSCCTAKLKLIIKNSSSVAISGATVELKIGSTVVKSTTSTADGYAIFENLCSPQAYNVRISKDGYTVKEFTVTYTECTTKIENITLSSNNTCCTGVLNLTIKNADGTLLSGATVQLKVDGAVAYSATSNSSGVASIDGICAPKTYSVRIVKDGYVVKEFSITYSECNTKSETIVLTSGQCCTAKLKLIIKNSDGVAISGAAVVLKLDGTAIKEATSNADGYVVFESLCAPKTYEVRITKDTYNVKEASFQYTECTTKIENITMTK